MRSLLWRQLACSAFAQAATVFEGTIGEGAALPNVCFVGVGSGRGCGGGLGR